MSNLESNVGENPQTQEERILDWLLSGRPLTALEALEQFGSFRLAARICELRRVIPIRSTKVKTQTGKRVEQYWIDKTSDAKAGKR